LIQYSSETQTFSSEDGTQVSDVITTASFETVWANERHNNPQQHWSWKQYIPPNSQIAKN